jgi:hypothetical protein
MPGASADPSLALKLRDSGLVLAHKPDSAFQQAALSIWVAGVLVRAGLRDSARRVLERTVMDPSVDPQGDLHLRVAFVLTLLGDREKAHTALRERLAMNPEAGIDLRSGWWFTTLADDPLFADLAEGRP